MVASQMPEAWKVTWDPEEGAVTHNLDPGSRTFASEAAARSLVTQLQLAGRRTVRLWFRPAQSVVSFEEVPL